MTLSCSSDANPAANYTWFKEHEDSAKESRQNYTITNFTSKHGGKYYCHARNAIGYLNSSIHLTGNYCFKTHADTHALCYQCLKCDLFSSGIINPDDDNSCRNCCGLPSHHTRTPPVPLVEVRYSLSLPLSHSFDIPSVPLMPLDLPVLFARRKRASRKAPGQGPSTVEEVRQRKPFY